MQLIEMSIPRMDVRRTVRGIDPLVASDMGYAVKTCFAVWGGGTPRPWRIVGNSDIVRVIGWAAALPSQDDFPEDVKLGATQLVLETGERMTLSGRLCAQRHRGKTNTRPTAVYTDPAGVNCDDPEAAYLAWAIPRLRGIEPHAEIHSVTIDGFKHVRVLRKVVRGAMKIVRSIVIPEIEVTVDMTVRNSGQVEQWLLAGVGPMKAFGFGGLFPC